jgi:hypothetical protein
VACFTVGVVILGFAGAAWMVRIRDNRILRRQAEAVTKNYIRTGDKIAAISHWVYQNQGFAKNRGYCLIKTLGPTPLQVLRLGGDCADKSRLVSAMLAQLGISSGLVMMYTSPDSAPIHTVVEAESEAGRMVVDPIWDVDYPASDGRYLGKRELAGTSLGRDRILELKTVRGADDKIAKMPLTEGTFDYVRAVNWQKNFLTKAVCAMLRVAGVDPPSLFRPRILEDPQLAIGIACLIASAASFVVGTLLYLY